MKPVATHPRLRLALWTPVPPQPSGIADYSLELLRQLVGWADVEVFVDQGVVPAPEVAGLAPVHPFFAFAEREGVRPFDVVLYQLGASLMHLYMLDALRERPGVVVLHDLTWGALLHRISSIWEEEDFRRELQLSEGEEALAAWDVLWAGDPETLGARVETFFETHPMLGRVVAGSLAQIVHLPGAAEELRARYPAASVFTFPMGVEDPWRSLPPSGWGGLRPALGIGEGGEGSFLIGAFGIADPVKRLHVAVRALARLVAEAPETDPLFVIVGAFSDPEYRRGLERLAEELGVAGRVRLLGRVPLEEFERALLACDAVVNLRYPFRRQMSATLMRAVAAGKPVLISDVEDWSHLPAAFCLRVAPDAGEEEALARHLLGLARDPAARREVSEAARRFYLEHATPSRMAAGYRRVLESVTGRQILEPAMDDATTSPKTETASPESSWSSGVLAWMEELLVRWEALRARASAGGFLSRASSRLRDLGVASDLQRDLFRAAVDHQKSLEERLGRMESRLEALHRKLAELKDVTDVHGAIAELRRGEADIRGALNEIRANGAPAALDSLRGELTTLRDRQDVLRARQARVEIALAGSGGSAEAGSVPLSTGDFSGLLALLDDGQASAVEVSVQDARAEGLVFAAQRHFGSRLSADFRLPSDLWVHADFTARWDRLALLENAADRLVPGGRFVLVTATETGEPARHPRLRLEEDRPVPLAGGGSVRVLAWRKQP